MYEYELMDKIKQTKNIKREKAAIIHVNSPSTPSQLANHYKQNGTSLVEQFIPPFSILTITFILSFSIGY